jgi:hypothetical protein
MRLLHLFLFLLVFTTGCNQNQKNSEADQEPGTKETLSEDRTEVSPAPVATYAAPVADPTKLNKFEFAVKLYETPRRFRYRVDVTYKMLEVKDSVDIPNFGYQPKVDVRPLADELSCMIGFYDDKGTFMDLKKVEIVENQLKMRQVKRYGVSAVKKKP